MYQLRTKGGKREPEKNWALPDKVFFACGACHILAYAFLRTYPNSGFAPIWVRPAQGYTGNHIVAVRANLAFDYHGYSEWDVLIDHFHRRAKLRSPGWEAEFIQLSEEVLISESESTRYDGLSLRASTEFLFNALPRAQRFLKRFPAPPRCYNRDDLGKLRAGDANAKGRKLAGARAKPRQLGYFIINKKFPGE